MKIYNALSKSFTDEVKEKMKGGGKSIDEAFEEVKMSIFGSDFDSPTPTPEPIDVNELTQGDGEENGYKYVDLGLSVKWATCNVGASIASDEGLLFQFGRVDGYRFNDTNHQFRTNAQNKQDTGNSYIPLTTSGTLYDKGDILDLEDDAAHVNMGGNWRMATCNDNNSTNEYEGEWVELINNTEKSEVTVNGINGILFTSNINGHKLFIPFMQGFWNGNNFVGLGSDAYMWSSQVHSFIVSYSNGFNYNSGGYASGFSCIRAWALSVRGVFNK